MPDIGFFELGLIGLVAFLVLGPERMPEFFGQIGRFARHARQWWEQMRLQMESESRALREPLDEARRAASEGLDAAPRGGDDARSRSADSERGADG